MTKSALIIGTLLVLTGSADVALAQSASSKVNCSMLDVAATVMIAEHGPVADVSPERLYGAAQEARKACRGRVAMGRGGGGGRGDAGGQPAGRGHDTSGYGGGGGRGHEASTASGGEDRGGRGRGHGPPTARDRDRAERNPQLFHDHAMRLSSKKDSSQTVSDSTAAAFQQMGVQRKLSKTGIYKEGPSHIGSNRAYYPLRALCDPVHRPAGYPEHCCTNAAVSTPEDVS